MDIGLEGENGLKLTQKIKSGYKGKAVGILSGYDLSEYREAAVQCGVNFFIGKDSDSMSDYISKIVECFHGAKDGGRRMPGCLWLLQDEKSFD